MQDLAWEPFDTADNPIGIKPEGSKQERMVGQSARVEAGHVFLPIEAPWLAGFVGEVTAFPRSRHDDQVDALSQFLKWIRDIDDDDDGIVGLPTLYSGPGDWE